MPVQDVSIVDLTVVVNKPTYEGGRQRGFQEGRRVRQAQGLHAVQRDPIVSRDVMGNAHSSVFDATLTDVIDGNLVKVFGWYDNEWGYSNRVVDLVAYIAKKSAVAA